MATLPPERLSLLRQAIHDQVSRNDVQEQIKACLTDAVAQEEGRPLDEATLLRILEERGLVEQVIRNIDLPPSSATPRKVAQTPGKLLLTPGKVAQTPGKFLHTPGTLAHASSGQPRHATADAQHFRPLSPPPLTLVNMSPEARQPVARAAALETATQSPTKRVNLPPTSSPFHLPPAPPPNSTRPLSNRRCLFLTVIGGRAFLDHLTDPASCCHDNFTLHLLFRGQRFSSREVPCACEPDFFKEGFLFELDKEHSSPSCRLISGADALSLSEVIQFSLTRTNHRGEVELVGTSAVEWRGILCEESGRLSQNIELNGVGTEAQISPGILDIQLDLVPPLSEPVTPELLTAQLELERQRLGEQERLFLVYAKQWWKEYLSLRADHANRLVKIFAPDETGVSRPVSFYVRPLRGGRLLESPRHAARMVSLIPVEKPGSVGSGGCCSEVWTTAFSVLASRRGTSEDHSCLLCSLLLGFGLEAWVCVGTKVKGVAHAWVMTLSHDGGVVFWESTTGQRYVHPTYDPNVQAGSPAPTLPHPYRTIGCVFNHESFYANCQPSNNVSTCGFNLFNSALWKPMSSDAIRSVCRPMRRCGPVLLPPTCDPSLAANEIEEQLRTLTSQHRNDLGLSTTWDEDLCYLLAPALAAYEIERCLGVGGVGNEEFQDAIHKAVPEGHTFKGFPLQVPHRNPRKMFLTCLKSPVCAEILGCKGDQVRLALRVKVYTYPENICAVWLMFAVKYHSIL